MDEMGIKKGVLEDLMKVMKERKIAGLKPKAAMLSIEAKPEDGEMEMADGMEIENEYEGMEDKMSGMDMDDADKQALIQMYEEKIAKLQG